MTQKYDAEEMRKKAMRMLSLGLGPESHVAGNAKPTGKVSKYIRRRDKRLAARANGFVDMGGATHIPGSNKK